MKWLTLQSLAVAGNAVLLLLLTNVAGFARQAPANTLEDSFKVLSDQVREMNATILELRAEVSQSRKESSEVREELRRALDKRVSANDNAVTNGQARLGGEAVANGELQSSDRLTQMEEDYQLLKDKVDEHYQTKVESASRYRMKLTGMVLLNVFGNVGRTDNQDVPNVALGRRRGDTGGDFGATARQSQLGFEVYGPTLAGAGTSADLHLDFFGGFPETANGTTSGLARLRTATVRLDWQRTALVVGQDSPFFSPLSPTSIASLGYPAFSYSGNLWTWVPQVRVEHQLRLSEAQKISLQAGIVDPLVGDSPYAQSYRTPQAGERSRQPAYGSRVAWIRGDLDRTLTLGMSGYYSRQNYGAGRKLDAWASTADWNVPLWSRVALSGEFYRGRGLGGLGGAQDRSALFNGPADDPTTSVLGLNSIGGWTQLKLKATQALEFNASYGQDHPFGRDLRRSLSFDRDPYLPALRNESGMLNAIYKPRTDLLFSLEYRRLNTLRITNERNTAKHINLGIGILF